MTGLASFFTLKHSLYDNMGNTTTRGAIVVSHVIVDAAYAGEEFLVGEEVIDVHDEDEARSHAECSPKSLSPLCRTGSQEAGVPKAYYLVSVVQ
jgi:hypothetical protein